LHSLQGWSCVPLCSARLEFLGSGGQLSEDRGIVQRDKATKRLKREK